MSDNNQPQSSFDKNDVISLGQEQPASKGFNIGAIANNLASSIDSHPIVEATDNQKKAGSEDGKKEITPVKSSDVYAMPKEFQHHNRVAGGNSNFWGILVFLGSFIFLAVIGVGFYLYVFNPGILSSWTGQLFNIEDTASQGNAVATDLPQINQEPALDEETASSSEEMASPTESPKAVYLKFLKDLSAINTFEDYYILVSEYGNSRKITEVEGQRLIAEATEETNMASVKAIKEKIPQLLGDEEINEKIDGDKATLNIVLPDTKASGTIEFTMEGESWRIGQENWLMPQSPKENIIYTLGEDRDGDGLTDVEEDLVASNKESTDSDKDTYSDLKEVTNLYNPIDTNKLVDNTRIKSYLPDDKSFYFLYPSTWRRVSDNGSPIFMGPNNHFFQLVIVDNANKETLDDYVKKSLEISQIKDSWRRVADTWAGIVSEDGLTFYATDLKQAKFYVFHYNPGDKNILEYPNIFAVMIKSFVINK